MDYERIVVKQPVHGVPVNVLRVGDTLVDTGHMLPPSRPVVEDELDGGRLDGVDRVVVTHPHSDHVGGSEAISTLAALPHVVYEGVPEILRNFDDYLGRVREELLARTAGIEGGDVMPERYFVAGDYAEDEIDIGRVVSDGDTVRVGPYDLEVVYTPGHSAHHMALYHPPTGTLLSGDLITQNGFAYGPLYADVGAYERSLRRVRDLDPAVLVPGHGPPVEDAADRIEAALTDTERTERAVLEAVRENGETAAHEVAETAFGDDPRDRMFLTFVACEYLEHLADRGEVAVEETDEGVVARSA